MKKKPKFSTALMPRLFTYFFATLFFLSGVVVGAGNGQLRVNSIDTDIEFYRGQYSFCIGTSVNIMYMPMPYAQDACNAAVRAGLDVDAQHDDYFNDGFYDPRLFIPQKP